MALKNSKDQTLVLPNPCCSGCLWIIFVVVLSAFFSPVPSFGVVYAPVGSANPAVGSPHPSMAFGYILLVLYSIFTFLLLCTLVDIRIGRNLQNILVQGSNFENCCCWGARARAQRWRRVGGLFCMQLVRGRERFVLVQRFDAQEN